MTKTGATLEEETTMRPPYGIIYGREGANFPDVAEVGPYPTRASAQEAVDPALVVRYGEVMIVSDWRASDGEDIATGAGRVTRPTDRRTA